MKKLIALLLVVAFVCVGTIGCGDTKSTAPAGGGKTPPAGSAGSAPKAP